MAAERRVKVRVREHRSLYVGDGIFRAGDEVTLPADEAEALIEQRFVEKPNDPLDADDVRDAEEARAVAESEQQRATVDRRMARGMAHAVARQAQQEADEEFRQRNAYERHLAAARQRSAAATPAALRGDVVTDVVRDVGDD